VESGLLRATRRLQYALLASTNSPLPRSIRAHRRLDAAVGEEAAEHDGFDLAAAQDEARFVVAKVSRPRLPSTTMSDSAAAISSQISAPQVP
jgi:hypothetical protein